MITKTCTWVEKADAQNRELRISHLKMLGMMFYRC